jgi:hypothetical protein
MNVQFSGLDDGLLKEADAQAEAYTSQVLPIYNKLVAVVIVAVLAVIVVNLSLSICYVSDILKKVLSIRYLYLSKCLCLRICNNYVPCTIMQQH